MGGKNPYLARQEEQRIIRDTQVLAWGCQLMLDAVTLVLNDPDYMGKDVFGGSRLNKLCPVINSVAREILQGMIRTNPGASYQRSVVDRRLEKITKENFVPWPERYEGWDDRGI